MKRLLIISFLLIPMLVGVPAFSASFQKGVDAYRSKNYATALKEFTPLAEQGDASAQSNLGLMYANGQGVSRNYTTALKWLNIAASQGLKNAGKTQNIVEKKMTPTQIETAQRLASEWVAKHQK